MSSKTELIRTIKLHEATIKNLNSTKDNLTKRLKDEIDKSARLLKVVHEGAAIVEELQSKKWWEFWK
jgi:hypothetical protein